MSERIFACFWNSLSDQMPLRSFQFIAISSFRFFCNETLRFLLKAKALEDRFAGTVDFMMDQLENSSMGK